MGDQGHKKNGSKTGKQVKKIKENEQEELKLASSLMSNYERKISELQNSNRILRREELAGSLDKHNNLGSENNNRGDSPHDSQITSRVVWGRGAGAVGGVEINILLVSPSR